MNTLNEYKKFVCDVIEESKDTFCALSDKIWELAELSLKEYESCAEYVQLLSELGFEVQERVAGIDTAFLGKWGCGKPVIGILGEFDALSSLSQVACATEHRELVAGGNGHGCGHNMLGAGALCAAYAVKEYLKNHKKSGTVIFYGTPGEEGGAGKAFMARENIWRELDLALTWHPSDVNEVTTGACNSCIQILYKFKGVPAHAAGDPENGRSALDGVELMNTGVQYLREHTKDDARIHYAIIDGGGVSPNVVQPRASVLYMIRSRSVKDALKLTERVDKIADGAALMSETSYERIFIDGCSDTVSNNVLERVLYDNLCQVHLPKYTEQEWSYATALKATYDDYGRLPSLAAMMDPSVREEISALTAGASRALNDFVAPLFTGDCFSPGSTDVGDVSWQTPTAQLHTACFASGAPGHSWQNVSIGRSSIGHKGLILAAKVLAMSTVELIENPQLIRAAREEFDRRTAGGYVCPIPSGEYAKAVDVN